MSLKSNKIRSNRDQIFTIPMKLKQSPLPACDSTFQGFRFGWQFDGPWISLYNTPLSLSLRVGICHIISCQPRHLSGVCSIAMVCIVLNHIKLLEFDSHLVDESIVLDCQVVLMSWWSWVFLLPPERKWFQVSQLQSVSLLVSELVCTASPESRKQKLDGKLSPDRLGD